MNEVVTFVSGKTDADIAKEYRAELAPHLQKIAEILDRSRLSGLSINFKVGPDQYGRITLQEINITKPL